MSRFQELKPNQRFVDIDEEILDYWISHQTFQKTLQPSDNRSRPTFLFYDGPPFATGLPHYGHILAGVIKDAICRFKTMQGWIVPRRFGWDCHGLPVEMEVQQLHNLPTNKEIESFGINHFNEQCRSIVDAHTSEWKSIIPKTGRWIDMDRPYRTMDLPFMESVWWCFAQLFQKNLIYEGFKILPYSWKAGTSVSNFEANLNYRSVQDPSVIIQFPLKTTPNTSFLAWTTTPWTLPSNMALCVHPKEIYVCVLDPLRNQRFILAKNCVEKIFSSHPESSPRIQGSFTGEELAKTTYIPPYDFGSTNGFIHHIVTDPYVNTDNGTGIVHQSPAHGEDDYRVCSANTIPYLDLLDCSGCFLQNLGELSGLFFKDANKVIIKYLKQHGYLFHHSTIEHSYPHCWRTDTPLLYKGMSTWFVKIESLKDDLILNNQHIHWVPQHIKEGRFGKWLKEAKDWDIGRNRFWGTPIPIWKTQQGELLCVSSVQELQDLSGKTITDLHRHHVDDITISQNGKIYTRVHQVLDCWFESGAMPYAKIHYPFENKLVGDTQLPAHFIAEGLDQTRGWFYTLLVLSTALQNKPPVQNILVTGLILAEDGQKMSKRLKNYPNPSIILESHGADALRLCLFGSGVVRGDSIKFSAETVQETLRHTILPLWNVLYFFTTYANIDGYDPDKTISSNRSDHWMDKWILSVCQLLVRDVTLSLEEYDLQKATIAFASFLDKLTNWYIRLNRRRFWKEENDADKWSAYSSLYRVLQTTCLVIAPLSPFLSEKMFHILRRSNQESVHTQVYPTYQEELVDQNIVHTMDLFEVIVKLGRSLRSEAKIKNRQPLARGMVICTDTKKFHHLQTIKHLLEEELNIKHIDFSGEDHSLVTYAAKPNLPVLGKSWGKSIPQIREKICALSQSELIAIKNGITVSTTLTDGTPFAFSLENLLLEHAEHSAVAPKSQGEIAISLDYTLTHDLRVECIARELINRIQKYRKELDLSFDQKITVQLSSHHLWKEAFDAHQDYLLEETLCKKIQWFDTLDTGKSIEIEGSSGYLQINVSP